VIRAERPQRVFFRRYCIAPKALQAARQLARCSAAKALKDSSRRQGLVEIHRCRPHPATPEKRPDEFDAALTVFFWQPGSSDPGWQPPTLPGQTSDWVPRLRESAAAGLKSGYIRRGGRKNRSRAGSRPEDSLPVRKSLNLPRRAFPRSGSRRRMNCCSRWPGGVRERSLKVIHRIGGGWRRPDVGLNHSSS